MPPKTLVIDNFSGRLTRYNFGDINSGYAKYEQTSGADPFSKPKQLTWQETATRIDPNETVITDLVMAGKERVESGITYLYCIGHTGRLYKIQVNDPTTYNPNYDNPVLLATLTSGTPTFTRGGFMDFFGTTERIYIGHDKGVTRVDFDGTNETVVGVAGSWTQTVPRSLKQFIGKLYAGNGANIAEIDSTATVTDYTKLDPALPAGTQVRDMDVSPDGNYLHMVVTRLALPDITSAAQDTTFLANSESYIFKWNGVDTGYTSSDAFPSFSLTANHIFGNYQYTFGYDLSGAAVFNPTQKILSPLFTSSPLPNAVGSNGNFIGWVTPFYYGGFLEANQMLYGSLDNEVGEGFWSQFFMSASGTETDVVTIPFSMLISNFGWGSSSNGYGGNVFSSGKGYFSTLETSASPTTKYKLYKWFPVSTTTGTAIGGVYETQNQMFSKKIKISQVRVYGSSWVANNAFTIDLIGSDLSPITNGSMTFTAGTNLTVGDDFAKYSPAMEPTYTLGVRVTNVGTVNHTINKIELDYTFGGE